MQIAIKYIIHYRSHMQVSFIPFYCILLVSLLLTFFPLGRKQVSEYVKVVRSSFLYFAESLYCTSFIPSLLKGHNKPKSSKNSFSINCFKEKKCNAAFLI